ncbi:MerR family transcriptional regulator [Bacteroidia bacterium]|nr:MerR family transcriptional regulator [Bacteroidia bacterium]
MKFQQKKMFYSIKEVASMLNVEVSLLRYWETQFPSLKPVRTSTKIRQYQEDDLQEIRVIYGLVKEQGLTLAAAKRKLARHHDKMNAEVEGNSLKLRHIRSELSALITELDEIILN